MLRSWLQLSMTDGVGPITAQRLLDACGSIEAACEASISQLRGIDGIGSNKAAQIYQSMRTSGDAADKQLARAEKIGVRIICRDDDQWPELLRAIPDPPLVLYMQGNLEPRDLNGIAIVGSRKCSLYGREQAERFGALLAGAGFTIVSGGARGIDSAAHRGAMTHSSGRTIAVLGSGVDVAYPPENVELFRDISQRGAVLSEYPLGTQPLAENFPRRNRIVSGISRGVLVIEADVRSGALITARQAVEDQNRPVFALPGRVDNQTSAGPHKLIREGATLVTGIEDIIEELHPVPQAAVDAPLVEDVPAPRAVPSLTDRQSQLLEHVSRDGAAVDQIVESSGLEAAVVLQELTFLSLKGVVRRIDGNNFAKRV